MKAFLIRIRFLLMFTLYFCVFFALDFTPYVQRHLISHWTDFLAVISGALITLVHPGVFVIDNKIINGASGIGVTILAGCNAVEACGLLIAAMFSFPTYWKSRLSGALIGSAAVQVVNLMRIVSLFYLAQMNDSIFEFAHRFLWQVFIMLDVLVVWLFWVRHLSRNDLILRIPK